MKYIIITLILVSSSFLTSAQVGIGNPTPDSTSVLDLTNPNNKGLMLPKSGSTAAMSGSEGMTYYFGGNLFYKRADGYNGLSPWRYRFNGNVTENVYYNLGGNIGIGLSDITVAPESPFQIATIYDVDLVSNGSFQIGTSLGNSLVINNNEIQTRNSGSADTLKINEDGGHVQFGSPATPVNLQTAGTVQQLHQPAGSYHDLLPAGSIIMWYGTETNIPEGWALCDGTKYAQSNGIDSIISPNLSGRFVVGTGDNGTTNYSAGATGGSDSVTLNVSEMPSHNHGVTDPGHIHNYNDFYNKSEDSDNADDRTVGSDKLTSSLRQTQNNVTNISINNEGGDQAHENRPTFTALVYIMKL